MHSGVKGIQAGSGYSPIHWQCNTSIFTILIISLVSGFKWKMPLLIDGLSHWDSNNPLLLNQILEHIITDHSPLCYVWPHWHRQRADYTWPLMTARHFWMALHNPQATLTSQYCSSPGKLSKCSGAIRFTVNNSYMLHCNIINLTHQLYEFALLSPLTTLKGHFMHQ